MKKNYIFILFFYIVQIAFGQELLTNGDFESWDDDVTPTSWTKVENIEKESTEKHGGSFSAKHTGGTKDLGQTISGIIPGKTYKISIWYKVVENDGTDARIWSYWQDASSSNVTDASTDGPLRGPDNGYLDNNGGQWTEYTANVMAPTGVEKLYFELRTYSGAVTYWDDLSVTCTDCNSTEPSLAITSPADNTNYNPTITEVNVSLSIQNFNVANGTGDGHIHYSLDNGTAVMKYDTNDIVLSGLGSGNHTVKVWLVDNTHNPLAPAVEKTINFTIAAYNQVSSLAALRQGTEGEYYHVTGEVILTYNAENARNQKYLLDKDGAGAILIDDNDGVLTTNYNIADGITGLKGKLSSYSGVLQLIPTENTGAATSTNNTITYEPVTLLELKNNPNTYESKPVKLENVTFVEADGTKTFDTATTKNYTISNAGETMTFRVQFSNVDFIDAVIPSGDQRVFGIASEFNSEGQLYGTKIEAMTTASIKENNIEGFSMFPNPVDRDSFVITTASVDEKKVIIYNVLGKKIITDTFTGNSKRIQASTLKTGIYLLKVVEGSKTVTKKLVIK